MDIPGYTRLLSSHLSCQVANTKPTQDWEDMLQYLLLSNTYTIQKKFIAINIIKKELLDNQTMYLKL